MYTGIILNAAYATNTKTAVHRMALSLPFPRCPRRVRLPHFLSSVRCTRVSPQANHTSTYKVSGKIPPTAVFFHPTPPPRGVEDRPCPAVFAINSGAKCKETKRLRLRQPP